MAKARRALRLFHDIKDQDEHFFWVGQPLFVPFAARAVPMFVLGLIWFGIDYTFIGAAFTKGIDPRGGGLFFILIFALHLLPFWIGCLNLVRVIFVFRNTFYAVTDKRIILRSGFLGIDYKVVDFDKISDIEVNVNFIERLFGCGTIRIHTGRDDVNSRRTGGLHFLRFHDHIYSVRHHYELFKNLKSLITDVKTDWMYPNKLRPTENPGYRTGYQGKAFETDRTRARSSVPTAGND